MSDTPKQIRHGNFLKVLGTVLIVNAVLCMAVGVLLALPGIGKEIILSLPKELKGLVLYLLFGIGFGFVGKEFIRLGKLMTVISGHELLKKDKRRPVLYLRSFRDDSLTAEIPQLNSRPALAGVPVIGFLYSLRDMISTDNEEEILAAELKKFGPCVAVGASDESLPELGMARLYFSEEEWQFRVFELIKKSVLVVIRAGGTEGVLLELSMAVSCMDPRKLVILLPFQPAGNSSTYASSDAYAGFCQKAEKILPKSLPVFYGEPLLGGTLNGVIWFAEDWTPTLYCFSDAGGNVAAALKYVFAGKR